MPPIFEVPDKPPTPTKLETTPLECNPSVPTQPEPHFPGIHFWRRYEPFQDEENHTERPLLKAIRRALRGADVQPLGTVPGKQWFQDENNPEGRELTWSGKNVLLLSGGVIVKRWSYHHIKESVQYACLGLIEQNAAEASKYFTPSPTEGSIAEDEAPTTSQSSNTNERPTFGPFAQSNFERRTFSGEKKAVSAVFVFLRSTAKIYLQNGIDFTINLPFVVRRAWPLSPHGVLVQRALEPSELEEAAVTGDPVLPTVFTITSPFQEPSAVGNADRIEMNEDGVLTVHTEAADVLKSIDPTEMVVGVTDLKVDKVHKPLVVTTDPKRRTISIWVYAPAGDSFQAKEAAPNPSTTAVLSQVKSRQPGHGRRTSAAFEGERLDSKHTISAGPSSSLPPTQELNADGFPVVTNISAAPTFSSMASVPGTRPALAPTPAITDERMRANYWMECILELDVPEIYVTDWKDWLHVGVFDERYDGTTYRSRVAILAEGSETLHVVEVTYDKEAKRFVAEHTSQHRATGMAVVEATRPGIKDLVYLSPWYRPCLIAGANLFQFGAIAPQQDPTAPIERPTERPRCSLEAHGRKLIIFLNEEEKRQTVDLSLVPTDEVVLDSFRVLSRVLPTDIFSDLHYGFITRWCGRGRTSDPWHQLKCLQDSLSQVFGLRKEPRPPQPDTVLGKLGASSAHLRLRGDVALKGFALPPTIDQRSHLTVVHDKPHPLHGAALYALHSLGEALRLQKERWPQLQRLAALICMFAVPIRPEWADYWKRIVPEALKYWPDPSRYDLTKIDDRLPTWPQDVLAYIHATLLNNKEDRKEFKDLSYITTLYNIQPSFFFGTQDPLTIIHDTIHLYTLLSEPKHASIQKRAEAGVRWLLQEGPGMELLDKLPIGVAAPIREAVRTCQLTPPQDWPLHMYTAIGRNDLAASASENPDWSTKAGYRPAKAFMQFGQSRPTIGSIIKQTRASASGEVDATSGVEMDDNHVGKVRFKDDRRLHEIGRMLNSSIIAHIKAAEKPEQSEHDQLKEQQNHVYRVAERTLSLPYGRAMYTFASVTNVTRESHAIPKMEFTIKVLPMNLTVTPDAGKINADAINWGEFHNGVAAGLRIAPTAKGVESSWIAFNKPSELTPEHAGFLYALGLTGHLRELMTWHTFQYLTPKHDLTSIAVLLGLAASHLGKGTQKVVKLLAVHTPALLPTPNVDLNVSLLTQAAGLSALGLLYMGTKNRRMAEVCLGELSRKELLQQDVSNEHREAYTFSAAIAFGMIMLGRGSLIPADLDLVQRLTILLHGDVTRSVRDRPINPFDITLTSPAAAIALGLMYLRTGRQDIADLLVIPDTAVTLNRIPPNFLLIRIIAKGLIMWDEVNPSQQWVYSQIPVALLEKMAPLHAGQARAHDDAYELAYHNLVAGCCFVLGLKFAGTASHDAYTVILHFYDIFTKLVFPRVGPVYDQKIKRATLREGLNQISLALSMVMAGTADISVMRRIRNAYGVFQNDMYHANFNYGVHIATMQSLGLLGLGGGRSTLGTSDAAIACLVAAFFPRQHVTSFDNKSYLQALRHLWVLAVEPRCLVARDVDTGEVVYLPVKISVKYGDKVGTSQLLSPTLIPSIDKLVSIRVDTPRYWPFFLDTALARNREALIRNQTLYVKRRTAFLSYIEDPRGSRSLFVRSGAGGPGDGQILDFPQNTTEAGEKGRDISEFITSFSNNVNFLAFADALCRSEDDKASSLEKALHSYAHAALLDCILQDKPQTLQTHLALYYARHADPETSYFNLLYHDIRFAAEFYGRVYERAYSGKAENNPRPGLLRDSQLAGAVLSMEEPLENVRTTQVFKRLLGRYVRNEVVRLQPEEFEGVEGEERRALIASIPGGIETEEGLEDMLAWYLLKSSIPNPQVLSLLTETMQLWRQRIIGTGVGWEDERKVELLDVGLRETVHLSGSRMINSFLASGGWMARSLEEVFEAWNLPR